MHVELESNTHLHPSAGKAPYVSWILWDDYEVQAKGECATFADAVEEAGEAVRDYTDDSELNGLFDES